MNSNRFRLQRKLTRCEGFSIIECLIALSIFTIGILAVAALVLSSIGENASARRITEATALAEDRLEILTAMSYDAVATPPDPVTQGAYTINWVVTEGDIVPQTKTISVEVSWTYRGKSRNVTIQYLLSPVA